MLLSIYMELLFSLSKSQQDIEDYLNGFRLCNFIGLIVLLLDVNLSVALRTALSFDNFLMAVSFMRTIAQDIAQQTVIDKTMTLSYIFQWL